MSDENCEGEKLAASQKPKGRYKLNSRQLLFARLVGEGKSLREAYRRAYSVSAPHGAAMLARHPAVVEEIARRRAEAEEASVLKRNEVLELLTSIILTPVADLDVNHPLVQEYTLTRRGEIETLRVKALSKMDAIKLLGLMCGWMKQDNEVQPMTFVLKKMWED
ncbi:hypothetical protein OJ996_00535 [Luteolibacter sp. GHJ8]|uniref:Terminase small subunit n=1 Tax=Luteolibacter rhizosphaerae TaxID=2989719 RepID=A0ABT3FWS3_9BACT|nr:hypothetical protein [Luteolibacter rhizosphaerae]MCW1912040.1 hypothetical protein [Luteolibacter rhizosphaerae]